MTGAARVYAGAAAAFAVFAVWGSLLPFEFRPVSFAEATDLLWGAGRFELARVSLTDAVSNFLLFVPIGLFVAATVERTWSARSQTMLVIAGGTLLSVTVEFGQAFVPWRTPSTLDILAEAAGTSAGVALWRMAARELDAAVDSALLVWRRSTTSQRLLLVYSVGFALAWLVPFDFTLRPDEIGNKYLHKRLLPPFTPSPDAAAPTHLRLAFAAAVPIGWAGAVCGCSPGTRRSVLRATLGTTIGLLVLALAQIPVFSRTTDLTILVAALPGVVLGAAFAQLTTRPVAQGLRTSMPRTVLAVTIWFVVALTSEWWPYRFDLDAERARWQMTAWAAAPFRPPASARDVLPGASLALAAGVLTRPRLRTRFIRLHLLMTVTVVGMVFVWIEAGRLLVPDGSPTLVSVLMKTAAFLCGISLAPLWPWRAPFSRKRGGT